MEFVEVYVLVFAGVGRLVVEAEHLLDVELELVDLQLIVFVPDLLGDLLNTEFSGDGVFFHESQLVAGVGDLVLVGVDLFNFG